MIKFIIPLITEISGIKQTKKDLRNFGIVMCSACIVISMIIYLKQNELSKLIYVVSFAGFIMLLMGLTHPGSLKIPRKLWMSFAVIFNYFLTRFILIVTYLLVIIPMGFFLKLIGKDLLDLKINKEAETFWKDYEAVNSRERYVKMF